MKISGSIQPKRNKWYMVISRYDEFGKRHQEWKSTELPALEKNRRTAEHMLEDWLLDLNRSFVPYSQLTVDEYFENWLKEIEPTVKPNTYRSYCGNMNNHIIPYFKSKRIRLQDLKPYHLEDYYTTKMKPNSKLNSTEALTPNTIRHHHNNISRALNDAVRKGILYYNPAHVAKPPKVFAHRFDFLNPRQIEALVTLFKGSPIELPVKLTAFYGLRRSEVLGLKWKNVDFINRQITISETLQQHVGGEYTDTPKTNSSYRTLPMPDSIAKILREQRMMQEDRKEIMGDFYTRSDYVCTWPDGKVITPNYLTARFHRTITNSNLPNVRLHDLRHSVASNLLAQGFSVVQVQEWLGHGSAATTLNIYAHVDKTSKKVLSDAMEGLVNVEKW